MDKIEIDSYCHNSGGLCVFRKRIKKAQFIVQSISILRDTYSSYRVRVEFDSLDMVDQGEGVRWAAKSDDLDFIIESLELFMKKPIEEWINFTKKGVQPFYDSEIVNREHYQNSWNILNEKYKKGKLLLPKRLKFELQTPDLGTLKSISKYQSQRKKKVMENTP
jgi:uncharacterized protein YqgQ